MRRYLRIAGVCLALGAAGCGGDDEEEAPAGSTSTAPPATQTTPATPTETDAEPPEAPVAPEEDLEPPPEEQPGGAGDEEPAQSLALFTGVRGRVRPPTVRVPPFIAIRIQLRSADRAEYGLACGGRSVRVDADIATASTRLAGRRPGQRIQCRALGEHNGVSIVASAEPGP